MRSYTRLLLPLLLAAPGSAAPAPAPVTLAWPLHGSEGAAGVGGWASSEVPVGAHWPFGGMRLGPDTTVGWAGGDWWALFNHYGGYFYNDTAVRAFSHTHAQGAGLGDGGLLGVAVTRAVPGSASAAPLPSDPLDPEPWRAPFSHDANESAAPGYYSVWLPSAAARAELTVSGLRAGIHRYTCEATAGGGPCALVFNGCHRTHENGCGPGSMALAPAPGGGGTLELRAALTESGAFASDCGGVPAFFYALVSATAAGAPATGLWADGALLPAGATAANSSGKTGSLGAYAAWPQAPGAAPVVVTVRVGLSYVSMAGAAANLAAEQGAPPATLLSFEAAAQRASAAWAAQLSAVVVNDVGYTDADVSKIMSRRAADAPAAAAAAAAIDASAGAAAFDAVGAWLSSPAGAAWAARAGGADVSPAALAAAAAAGRAAAARAAAMPPLAPMPPAQRLGSFYSSLYHAFAAPTVYSDADGAFVGLDRAVHAATWRGGAGAFFSDFSLWDVYRTQMPLLVLLAPVAASDIFESMLAMFAQTNNSHVPHWVWANCETGCMPGSHGLAVLADFMLKGVVGPNASALYAAAAAQLAAQDAQDDYNALGFVPVPGDGSPDEGASLTLEYAFDDFAGAAIAAAAGQPADAARWAARAQNYANVWNADAGGMCPRFANGSFPACPPLDLPPILLNKWYTEGDGLQWTFAVPHNVSGLISLFPSPQAYVDLLQGMMVNTSLWAGPTLAALPNPWRVARKRMSAAPSPLLSVPASAAFIRCHARSPPSSLSLAATQAVDRKRAQPAHSLAICVAELRRVAHAVLGAADARRVLPAAARRRARQRRFRCALRGTLARRGGKPLRPRCAHLAPRVLPRFSQAPPIRGRCLLAWASTPSPPRQPTSSAPLASPM
jgi:putative alpha-1,2-mannosidase